jgi:hypothetical protein
MPVLRTGSCDIPARPGGRVAYLVTRSLMACNLLVATIADLHNGDQTARLPESIHVLIVYDAHTWTIRRELVAVYFRHMFGIATTRNRT